MHIILTSALYPPDIAVPAPYVKELASRLSENHSVSVVTYGNIPEKVKGVEIISIPKHSSILTRLFLYTIALIKASKKADILYSQNGASVELPVTLSSWITKIPVIHHYGDPGAHARAQSHRIFKTIEKLLEARSQNKISSIPTAKPEVFPLEPRPVTDLRDWEESWSIHVNELTQVCNTILKKP